MREGMTWVYRAVFTQTDVGGGNVKVTITFGEDSTLLWGSLGSDDYAAGRAVTIYIYDSGGNIIGIVYLNAGVDNQQFSFPDSDHSAIASGDGPYFEKRAELSANNSLVLLATALAQNETVKLALRARIKTTKPTVVTTGSTGTVTTTETYNKVV